MKMNIRTQQLLELLPAIHRIRDAEIANQNGTENGPLEDLIAIVAEQMALLEENIEQSYDDLFIETCADWLTPYIGDVIGYQSLHGNVPDVASPRAEVAHTIALRRRKGTAVVLEQLARDVTGWGARAVEFFKDLGWTQHMNHHRNDVHYSPDLRKREPLARIGTAFNSVQHTVDVRRVETNRGRFNIPNIGIFLWRLNNYPRTEIPALRIGERRYLASPLGHPVAFYSFPQRSEEGFISQLSEPENVAEPLSRRQLHDHLDRYYGFRATAASDIDNKHPSIVLYLGDVEITRDKVCSCDLSDDGLIWAHQPKEKEYAIDPELGRIALRSDMADPSDIRISFQQGFSADMGGGEYPRENSFSLQTPLLTVPGDHSTIQAALDALGGSGVVEITDNNHYIESLNVNVAENSAIEIRAINERIPQLVLTAPLTVMGEEGSRFSINGCLVSGDLIAVNNDPANQLTQLDISHCSLVPGRSLDADGMPEVPAAVSLRVALPGVTVSIERSIIGSVQAVAESNVKLLDSIMDATHIEAVAFADVDGDSAGASLNAISSTIIGKIHAREFVTVSNCILLARRSLADSWKAPVWTERKQTGCVRFSFLPFDSIVPRRYRCQPDSAETALNLSPSFTSLQFGQAAYAQLSTTTAEEIWRGADDESEMGAFHHLYAPQRDRNLRIRLNEYLRVGLEAGLFYAS